MPDRVKALHELAERLRHERDRHVAFAFAAADLLIETTADARVVSVSGAVHAVLGIEKTGLAGRPVEDIAVAQDRPVLRKLLAQIARTGRIEPAVLRLARQDGTNFRAFIGGCQLPSLPDHLFLSFTQLPSSIGTVEPERDQGTGLLTVEGLIEAAQRAAADGSGRAKEVKLVRLDGLSDAVQQLSAERGAALLEEIGATLRATSVGGDSAGRVGADAFGIVTRASEAGEGDGALAAQLDQAISAAGVAPERIAHQLARIELALDGLSESDMGRALSYAVNRFVEDRHGEFSIATLQEGLSASISETTDRIVETRRLIAAEEFSLVFQPVVDIASRTLHHWEALLRLPGNANTFETVVFSENTGLVAELDLAVCRRAISVLERNAKAAIAVNLSGRSVQDDGFRRSIEQLVQPLGRDRRRLMFELTESACVDDLDEAANFLRWLRKLGHAVCLDDFGAGAAAYSYLRRFDVDFVKIDGPFLRAALQSRREHALIRSICVLCEEIGCKVIGEMIETEEGAALSHAMGIELGQGWLFGKPIADMPRSMRVTSLVEAG